MSAVEQDRLLLGIDGRDHYQVTPELVDMTRPALPVRAARVTAQPQSILVDLEKSALIVVDMQNDFCSDEGWVGSLGIDTSGARAIIPAINAAVVGARAAGVRVIWVSWGVRPDRMNLPAATRYPFSDRKSFDGLGAPMERNGGKHASYRLLAKDEWGAAIADGLEVDDSDIRIDKHRISGFWDTPLDSVLRSLMVRTLFFAGVNSDHCVLGTLMDASFLGFDTVMLEDCVATTSPAECHTAALHNVRFCFGFTSTSRDLVAAFNQEV